MQVCSCWKDLQERVATAGKLKRDATQPPSKSKHNARERNRIFTEHMPATTMLNGLFNVLTHVTWDVDAHCPAAVSSSLTADQPIHPVGTICAQIARYSLRQPTGMEHALTVQMTKHESTTESKSEAHPSN